MQKRISFFKFVGVYWGLSTITALLPPATTASPISIGIAVGLLFAVILWISGFGHFVNNPEQYEGGALSKQIFFISTLVAVVVLTILVKLKV